VFQDFDNRFNNTEQAIIRKFAAQAAHEALLAWRASNSELSGDSLRHRVPVDEDAAKAKPRAPVIFANVDLAGLPPHELRQGDGVNNKFYKGMCDFFAGNFYRHPVMRPFRWYMREDSDLFWYDPDPDGAATVAGA